MSAGYVYILSNPSMPNLLKIGRSQRTGAARAKELHSTGTPTPFKLEFELFCDGEFVSHESLEVEVHERLDRYRLNESREFFRISIGDAISQLMDCFASNALNKSVVDADDASCVTFLRMTAGQFAIDGDELVNAIHCISEFSAQQAIAERKRRRLECGLNYNAFFPDSTHG